MNTTTASPHSLPDQLGVKLRADIAEVMDIYTLRFPLHRLRLILSQGHTPFWGEPSIIHGPMVIQPTEMTADFIGHVDCGNTDPLAPLVTVKIALPRTPNPVEAAAAEPDWAPRSRALRLLYRASPMAYERLRHRAERRQEAAGAGHVWKPLQRGVGLPQFAAPAPETAAPPTILIGMHWLDVGGAEKLAFDCIKWAQAAGLRVIVVASVASAHRLAHTLPSDVQFLRLDRYLPHEQWTHALEQLVLRENVRLIHIHHCVPIYAALAHLRMVAPWVRIVDSTHIVEYADGGYPRVSGVWSNYIDVHHVISNQLVNLYRSRFLAGPKAVLGRMVPPGNQARVLPPLTMAARKPALEISFIGRLYYQKRPITVLLAMRALADWADKAGVKVTFNMVGEGPFAAACASLSRKLGIADRLKLHPASADVRAILARSDIMILPSANEGLALVCYEAIEQGAIPISTNVGAQGEIVPPDLLVPRDPAQACAQIVRIVDRLWSDQAFVDAQSAMLHDRYRSIASDPTAQDVLTDIYRAALNPS